MTSLSDKIIHPNETESMIVILKNPNILVEDVREAVRKLKDNVYLKHSCAEHECRFQTDIQNLIDEIFGEKLL